MAMRSSKTIALGALPVMALAFLSGCGGEDEVAYCVDQEDTVVDNSFCDDDFNGTYFWSFIAANEGSKIVKGAKIKKAASKIAANNKAALSSKGGFGSSAGASAGIGRAVASSSGGSSSGGG